MLRSAEGHSACAGCCSSSTWMSQTCFNLFVVVECSAECVLPIDDSFVENFTLWVLVCEFTKPWLICVHIVYRAL